MGQEGAAEGVAGTDGIDHRDLVVRIGDGSGYMTLRFFHFSREQQAQFQPGIHISCFGEVRRGSSGFEMIHPEYRILREVLGLADPTATLGEGMPNLDTNRDGKVGHEIKDGGELTEVEAGDEAELEDVRDPVAPHAIRAAMSLTESSTTSGSFSRC